MKGSFKKFTCAIGAALMLAVNMPVFPAMAAETTVSEASEDNISEEATTRQSENEYKYYAGTKNGNKLTVRTEKNNYTGSEKIGKKDPHYGWNLGYFRLKGYTDKGDSDDIYLKNSGDSIEFSFKLEENISCLNGKKNLTIANDEDGYDGGFKQKKPKKGKTKKRGELLIKYTNEKGESEVTKYPDYLKALTSENADTKIQLGEEGDYEIHLDYAIKDTKGIINTTTYYRTSFKFKIRNGNCKVFTYDSASGSELLNGDSTANGFRIDTEDSKYLKVHIRKQIMNEVGDDIIPDTRFNRPANDGDVFTDEGIYTITADNQYDKYLDTTEQVIYVGKNNILANYTKHLNSSEQYTIAQLKNMEEEGYTIKPNGAIIEPVTTTSATSKATSSAPVSSTVTNTETEQDIQTSRSAKSALPYVGGTAAAGVIGAFVIVRLIKNKNELQG